MAANLLKAGFSLSVYNRTAAKAQALIGAGARFAARPAEAAKDTSVIISMLSDDAASREVWLSSKGALEAAEEGAILIESSTVSPAWIVELADAASRRGINLLDSPVTGSRTPAEAGQLSFLVGGSDAALEKVAPVLKA